MRNAEVRDETYAKLALAAHVAGISISEVIDRLASMVDEHSRDAAPVPQAVQQPREGEVAVYVTYKGERIEGMLDLRSERLRITRGPDPLPGQTFKSPTQAAVTVVKTISPTRQRPQTNGWRFWRDADSKELINDTLREH